MPASRAMLASAAMLMRATLSVRPLSRIPGLLLAVLALVSQLALGSLAPLDAEVDVQRTELAALTVLCQTALVDGSHAPAAPHHHRLPDYAPSPLAAALDLPCFVVVPTPVLPAPSAGVKLRLVSLLSARGPPSHKSHLGFPRGPPVLV